MITRKLFLASALLFSLYHLPAQITITTADMPNVTDNIVISVNTGLQGFHADSTGPNHLWDWSRLIPDSQRVVQCVVPATTPYGTYFTFLCGFSGFGIRNYTPDLFPFSLLGTAPTDAYDFYKKTNTSYNIVGTGINASGTNIPEVYLPISAPDRVYKLPMNYLQKDSSSCTFGFPVPGLGYYAKKQKRVNLVDGWGTLITPYGTFSTLRVKSILTITDSIYIDTLGFGFSIPRALQFEFKWLAKGMKIPLLEIDATGPAGNILTVIRANWRDSLLVTPSVAFVKQNSCPVVNEGSLTANPSGERYPITYLWSSGQTTPTISNLAPGAYTVTITDRYGRVVTAVDSVQALNDSTCMILVNFTSTKTCPAAKDGSLTATVSGDRPPSKYLWSNGDTTLTTRNLAPGDYQFLVTDKYGRQGMATGTVQGLNQDLSCLNIPSAFTPDGDGVNDVWKIRSLSEYTESKIEIFNQWGSLVWRSTGYETPWDGRYNGDPVPAGAYYYVIDLANGSNKYTGTVTIIR